MSKARKSGTVYLVQRVAYRAWDFETLNYSPCDGEEGESLVPVRAFATREAAEACRAELEAEARAALPPALFASSTVPRGLAARIESLGLEPPRFGKQEYNHADQFRRWWVEHAAEITPEHQAAIWELFGDVELYRVASQRLEG